MLRGTPRWAWSLPARTLTAASRWPRPLLLLVALLASSAALIVGAAHPASAADLVPASYGVIANRALASIAQNGGECFTWMRQVVFEATGRTIGVDYRLGYLQAGATEVTIADARNGDIIQLINDAKSDPAADYPGMHTAIVLESQGDGKFRVIDSNFRLDHIVRVHDNYDPKAHAAQRANIAVHVYRMPSGSAPTSANSGTGTQNMAPGNFAEVVADGDCLRLRVVAGLNGFVLGCLATGMNVVVLPERAEADGLRWQRVTGGGFTGWAADRYLRPMTEASATPGTAPTPSPTVGKIVGGAIPSSGVGLIVFGGGTNQQLSAAIGCPASGTVWATTDGQLVQFIPGATIAVVNEAWNRAFPTELPANIALLARCG